MTANSIRMFFTGSVISILLCVIVRTSLWWQNKKRSPEITLWLVNYILQLIALLFITFRGIIPDLFSIVLANLFIIGGTVILYVGLGRYAGRESRQLHNYVMLAVFTLAYLYFTYVDPDNVVQVAEKVLQVVSQPIIFEGQKAVVSTSIGIALFPDHSEDMDKLIKLADEAMYKVKNSGKNGFRFVNIMTE
ncbi:hypothetical protein ER57_18755 [Smithella sp. SCADC]|nr:hypothetical protein ER57_18755 [Smithella sp. SCADC]